MTNIISQHTFNAHANRINQPKVFFGANNARTTEYTGIDWGAENNKLKNRVRRINLEEAQASFFVVFSQKNQKICKI